jgi:hypothetical protein
VLSSGRSVWLSVGDGRHSQKSVRPFRVDSDKESQPATDRGPSA